MRKSLLISLFALLVLLPAAQAMDSELPSCSSAELDSVSELMVGFHKLAAKADRLGTLDELLAYSQTHISWRDKLWSSLPHCSPAFETALLANQLSGDFVTAILLTPHRELFDENPYTSWQLSGTAELEERLDGLPPPSNLDDKVLEPTSTLSTLVACTDKKRQYLLETTMADYGDLTDNATSVEDFDDFLNYIEAQFVWRRKSLSQYPPCAEAVEVAWLTSQTASDIATLFAFYFIGQSVDESPYSQPERASTERLRILTQDLRETSQFDEAMQTLLLQATTPSGGNWHRCSADELRSFAPLLTEYQYLENMAVEVLSLEQLLDYSIAQIQWRESLSSKLPQCGEVLEIAWIISENIGDLALLYALNFLDVCC